MNSLYLYCANMLSILWYVVTIASLVAAYSGQVYVFAALALSSLVLALLETACLKVYRTQWLTYIYTEEEPDVQR